MTGDLQLTAIFFMWCAPRDCWAQKSLLAKFEHPDLSLESGVDQAEKDSVECFDLIISSTSRIDVPTVGWWWPCDHRFMVRAT